MPACEPVQPDLLSARLEADPLWHRVTWTPSTGSTNKDLVDAVRGGEPAGQLLVTEEQTGGRGRFERRWESPAGTCVAMSALLEPSRPALDWGWLSLLAGMAVATGLERATGAAPGRVQLKWPNDVLVDGRKICGILSERVEVGEQAFAVVGIGINISLDEAELPVPTGTSLLLAGLPTDKTAVVAEVWLEFARLFRAWEAAGELHDSYSDRCDSIGAPLRVLVDEHTSVMGTGDHVDEYGRLVVRTDSGLRTFSAGDVFHLRKQ